ncbi:60S ribosomal protein L25 [Hanseniaspora opuntiae]
MQCRIKLFSRENNNNESLLTIIIFIKYFISFQIAKASAAKKAVFKGTNGKKALKVRNSATFRLPKTLKPTRAPKYASKVVSHYNRLDAYKIIEKPITSESSLKKVEDENILVFQVSMKSNKHQIKKAVKELYNADVLKVNTLVRPNGTKKAYVRLTADHDALEIASDIGYI